MKHTILTIMQIRSVKQLDSETDEKQKDNKRNNHEGKDKSNQNTSQNMDHVIGPKQP